MKHALAVSALLICSLPPQAHGQASQTSLVERLCRAAQITTGPEVQRVETIEARLGHVLSSQRVPGPKILAAVVDSGVINSWEVPIDSSESLICIPVGMVQFMGDSEGEMAFIVAHETGHALDSTCKTQRGRAAVTPPSLIGIIDKLLGGSGQDVFAEQRTCESRADAIGYALLVGAGYSPYDAAGAFGRLEMYIGDTSTNSMGRFRAIASDHPITPDRIAHMRALLDHFGGPIGDEMDASAIRGNQGPPQKGDLSGLGGGQTDDDARYMALLFQQANDGDVAAQFILGFRYETGNGVTKNFQLARYWYAKAANGGSSRAKDALDRMNEASTSP